MPNNGNWTGHFPLLFEFELKQCTYIAGNCDTLDTLFIIVSYHRS